MNISRKTVATLATTVVLAAGCSDSKSDPNANPDNGANSRQLTTMTPAAKGPISTVTWNNPSGPPTSLDPALASANRGASILANVCESLMAAAPDGTAGPGIARSFTSPDPLTYVFTLRDDVKFWNGDPVTADDVAFSLQRSATLATSGWRSALRGFASAMATDRLTVTVKLAEPNVLFPTIMATGAGAVLDKEFTQASGEAVGSAANKLMCTGPFKVSAYEPGTSATITKNADYWNKSVKPMVDNIVFKFITDDTTLTQALQSGEIDGSFFVPYTAIDQLTNSPAGKIYYGTPNTNSQYWIFHQNSGSPLSDPRLRQAMRHAMDWDGILNGIFHGAGELLKAPAGPSSWTYSEDIFKDAYEGLPEPKQDLPKAKALVEEAGAPADPIVCVSPAGIQTLNDLCLAVIAAAESIGLKAEAATIPLSQNNAVSQAANEDLRKGYDLYYVRLPMTAIDPLDIYNYQASTFGWIGYTNPEATDLIKQAGRTVDDDARAKLIVEAQSHLVRDLPWQPLLATYQVLFMSSRITGATLNVAQWYPWAVGIGSAN